MAVEALAKSTQTYLARSHDLLIDGKRMAGSDRPITVIDPATEAEIAEVSAAGADDIDRAVAAARTSFADGRWSAMAPEQRRDIMWRLADLIAQNAEELVHLEVADNGMPLAFAEWEINACVGWLRHFAGQTTQIFGRDTSSAMSGGGLHMHSYTIVQPVGVVALVVPWNAPAGNFMIKAAPALAAGNSIVAKPAELTPLSALRIGELALEAGVPAGVLNIVPGYGDVAGRALAEHPGVDKISFTGSTETGKSIVRASAGNLKRVTLELGGKSPVIVCADADLAKSIPQVAMAIFANTGQVCFAGSRLFVHRAVYEEVVEGVAEFARQLKVGSGFDRGNLLGPLISGTQRERVMSYVEGGRSDGASVVTGGRTLGERGYFIEPTIFADIGEEMAIHREEIFGPVLVATRFDDIDEVVRKANDTRYGLGSGIFTRNVNKAHLIARRIDAGNVWVNCYGTVHPSLPFGGFKESGWGREMGAEAMQAFSEVKSVIIHLDPEG